jgi:hypothetical protein
MKKIVTVLLVALAILLDGCVSPRVETPVPTAVDIKQFNEVKLVTTDEVNTPFSREGLPMFEGLIKAQLQSSGYTLVDSNAEMVIEVTVRELSPGNRALRTTVGFGAGRAVLKYTARFKDSHGNLLAKLEGGKAYTGMELEDNPTFKSDESTRMGLVSDSVSQIGRFIQDNGRTGQAAGPVAQDKIGLSFEMSGGQLIPRGLPQPEAWVYFGKTMVPGKALDMTWVKPVVMPPRQDQSDNPPLDNENSEAALALLERPQVGKAPEWSECFEYLDLPLPAISPQEYLVGFTEHLESRCPTASVIPIRVSSTDLLLEIKSGGCELYGDQAEIDCFLFGKTDLFHMTYSVKSRELTPEQRETGIKLVTTWKIEHPN